MTGRYSRSRTLRVRVVMLLEAGMLQGGVGIVAAVLGGLALAVALYSAPWRAWLDDSERQWVWFGSMACWSSSGR